MQTRGVLAAVAGVSYGAEVTDEGMHRRPVLKVMVTGTLALGAVGTASRLLLSPEDRGPQGEALPALQLSADSGSDVRAIDIALGDDLLPRLSSDQWGSSRLITSTHSMVAFTWSARSQPPRIQIRSRVDGVWRGWRRTAVLHDLPDLESGEDAGVAGTDLVWIGDADGIQVQIHGQRPDDLTMVLLHPSRRGGDLALAPQARGLPVSISARGTSPTRLTAQPTMLSRVDWGADETWRDGSPRYNATIEQVHVHHTANSNDYSRDDVPALIRGMYRYHTHNLGWSDIAYNFLVDRFGRIWVGRAGGAARPVRGAHTLGFNATSTGISVIGNFDLDSPSESIVEAIAQLAAWKLSRYGRSAEGSTRVLSQGSDTYPRGDRPKLPTIDGHRDTNDTSCPGGNLYAVLPTIRTQAAKIIAAAQLAPIVITQPPTIGGSLELGGTLTVVPGVLDPPEAVASYSWLRDAVRIPGATSRKYVPVAKDVGAQLSVRITYVRDGYLKAREELQASEPVRVVPTMTVRAIGRRRRAVIHVEVAPTDYSGLATGAVRVQVERRRQKVELVDGRATARFIAFTKGRHDVVVTYGGDSVLLPAQITAEVRVG